MFKRYRVVCRKNNSIIFDDSFSTINQAVKACIGFNFQLDDLVLHIADVLTDNVFPTSYVHTLTKEFRHD